MKFGRCWKCKKFGLLTRHSLFGNHQPPYKWVHRKCHDEIHGMKPPKTKINKKYQKGTKRIHKRGWRKK